MRSMRTKLHKSILELAAALGKNDLNTPDAGGKLFIKEIVAIDKDGWVDYKFKSPADNRIHDKSSYVVRVGDFLVGAGAYKY